jgi:uncharacterized protein YkwD
MGGSRSFRARSDQVGVVFDRYSCDPAAVLRRLAAVAAASLVLVPTAGASGLTRSEDALLREMNRVRVARGLQPLTFDARLERAARAHSREMIRADTFEHGDYGSRLVRFDVHTASAGENIAWVARPRRLAHRIVAAWLASPGHRANVLAPGFTRVGVGIVAGPFLGRPSARVITADFAG